MRRVHIIINGHVQGVGFRNMSARISKNLGLYGWVRNLPNGSVEVDVQGSNERIEEFIFWCRRGPPKARVDEIKISEENPIIDLERFRIKY